jgi:hypothetical protein
VNSRNATAQFRSRRALGFREPAVGRYRSIGGLGEEAVRHEAEEDWG